jgi:hypothetical protein
MDSRRQRLGLFGQNERTASHSPGLARTRATDVSREDRDVPRLPEREPAFESQSQSHRRSEPGSKTLMILPTMLFFFLLFLRRHFCKWRSGRG